MVQLLHSPLAYRELGRALSPFTRSVLQALHKIIFSMRNSPARGDDGICIRVLKLAFSAIGPVLLHLINMCITTNNIPDLWKHSRVIPIHKSGDPTDPSNFRPISILPVISKVVERTVQRQLYYYLSSNHLLSPTQHGFRPRHSTETALTIISDENFDSFRLRQNLTALSHRFEQMFRCHQPRKTSQQTSVSRH